MSEVHKMMPRNYEKRIALEKLQVELFNNHSSLENYHHRSMQYVQMILMNKEMYCLDERIIKQLEAIQKIGNDI